MSGEETEEPVYTCDDFVITSDFNAEEYNKNWSDRLSGLDEYNDYKERDKVFEKFYNYIWKLLFGPDSTQETRDRAIELLVAERPDAAFFNPFIYNDWIRTVKDEIIKQKLFDLWKNEFVTKQLGLIWARDSDYFDDMEDPEPNEFYKLNESD